MSRISCNVTKDLLAPYLDKICSGESRELVEEHLQECPSCRQFLETLREQDLGGDVPKVDYLRKMRRYMDVRSVLGIIVLLVVISIGVLITNYHGINQIAYYYVEMPILMLAYAFVLEDCRERSLPVRLEWLVPVGGFIIAGAALFLRYYSMRMVAELLWKVEASLIPSERLVRLGPTAYLISQLITLAALALLVTLFVLARRRKCVFLLSQNLAWLGMNLALAFGNFLRNMSEPEVVEAALIRNAGILIGEFVAVTAFLFLYFKLIFRKGG